MFGFTAILLGSLTFPVLAPTPQAPRPDPMARGYIGVTISVTSLMIESVEPGKPAFNAGIRSNDLIVRVGTLEPRDYNQVIAHICSFRPGAIIEIEVQRGSERKTFKVTLTERPIELDLKQGPVGRPVIDIIDR